METRVHITSNCSSVFELWKQTGVRAVLLFSTHILVKFAEKFNLKDRFTCFEPILIKYSCVLYQKSVLVQLIKLVFNQTYH